MRSLAPAISVVLSLAVLSLLLPHKVMAEEAVSLDIGTDSKIAISPNGSYLASIPKDTPNTIKLIDASKLVILASVSSPSGGNFQDVIFDSSNRKLLAITEDARLFALDLPNGTPSKALSNFKPDVVGPFVQFSMDGGFVITSDHRSVQYFDIDRGVGRKIDLPNQGDLVQTVESRDKSHLLLIQQRKATWIRVADGQTIKSSDPLTKALPLGKFSPQRRYFIIPSQGQFFIADLTNLQHAVVDGHAKISSDQCAAFTQDDNYLSILRDSDRPGAVDVWRLDRGIDDMVFLKPFSINEGHSITGGIRDEFFFAGRSNDGPSGTYIQCRTLKGDNRRFGSCSNLSSIQGDAKILSYSADSRLLAAGTKNGFIQVWDPNATIQRIDAEEPKKQIGASSVGWLLYSARLSSPPAKLQWLSGGRSLLVNCSAGESVLLSTKLIPYSKVVGADLGNISKFDSQFTCQGNTANNAQLSENGAWSMYRFDTIGLYILDSRDGSLVSQPRQQMVSAWFTQNPNRVFIAGGQSGFLDLQTRAFSPISEWTKPTGNLRASLISGLRVGDQNALIESETGNVAVYFNFDTIKNGMSDLSNDNRLVVCGGRIDGSDGLGIEVFDLTENKAVSTIQIANDGLYGVYFLSDSKRVVTIGARYTREYDYRRNRVVKTIPDEKQDKADAEEIARKAPPSSITGGALDSWMDEIGGISGFSFMIRRTTAHHPQTDRIAIATGGVIEVLDWNSGKVIWKGAIDGEGEVESISFSKNGKSLAVGTSKSGMRIIHFER